MFKTPLTPPTVDQATIDHYVAKGRRERSRAITEMVRSLFSAPAVQKPVTVTGKADCTA